MLQIHLLWSHFCCKRSCNRKFSSRWRPSLHHLQYFYSRDISKLLIHFYTCTWIKLFCLSCRWLSSLPLNKYLSVVIQTRTVLTCIQYNYETFKNKSGLFINKMWSLRWQICIQLGTTHFWETVSKSTEVLKLNLSNSLGSISFNMDRQHVYT